MTIKKGKIGDIFEIQLEPKFDSRGFFMRTYDEKIFRENGIHRNWVQESHSLSKKKGTVRGFHFQLYPYSETKLVRVLQGEILFTILDLRIGSETLGKWMQVVLSSKKNNLIYIPKGFGSCMCTLTSNCQVLYKMDEFFNPDLYTNIKWDDPDLKIKWPVKKPSEISERDLNAQSFKQFIKTYGGIKVK